MINLADIARENIREGNINWPQISDQPHRILIVGGSGSGKTNSLLKLIIHQPDTDLDLLICQGSIWSKISIVC